MSTIQEFLQDIPVPEFPIVKLGYRPQAEDTSIEADTYLFAKLRQLSLKQRVEIAISHDRCVRKLCLAGIEKRGFGAPIEEIRLQFAHAVLAEKFPLHFKPIGSDRSMWIQDSIALAQQLHLLFEGASIPYYVSGGVASSVHGEARSTRDLDLVLQIEVGQIDQLVAVLEASRFYCPALSVEDIKSGRERMLNITHTETIANADLYVMDNSPFAVSQMSRRQLLDIEGMPSFWIASPEDIILQKLLWGRGSQSAKQWRDVLGILKLQSNQLDYSYLTQWSANLGLIDILNQAFSESGIP